MEEQSSNDIAVKPKNVWAERLRGRGRMAVACIGGVLALGLMGLTNPLLDRIAEAETRLKKAETRASLAAEISSLRKQSELYHKKLPQKVDLNDWTEYLLTGIRSEPVKLIRMDPKDQAQIGPTKVVSWQVEMEGDYQALGRVLAWLENGERLVRIDKFVMQLPNGKLSMMLYVRGLSLDKPEVSKESATTRPTTKPSSVKKEPAKG